MTARAAHWRSRRGVALAAGAILGAALLGAGVAVSPRLAALPLLGVPAAAALFASRPFWAPVLWFALFGLAVWSYGFNNVPLVRPIPLVDALAVFAVTAGLPAWWPLQRLPVFRRLLVSLACLTAVVFWRLMGDVPRYGIVAGRDALFVPELWALFPAAALGAALGPGRVWRRVAGLFLAATAWFLLYPWREAITAASPTVGLQRPVPFFSFTGAVFLAVPAFYAFVFGLRGPFAFLGGTAALVVIFLLQSRSAYLALLGTAAVLALLRLRNIRALVRLFAAGALAVLVVAVAAPSLPGRVGVPVGLETVLAQLETLLGQDGPGAGSYRHRLQTWPHVLAEVRARPFGPLVGVGFGPDLFQGFATRAGVLVRKPHNDFLEVWARTGLLGLLPWLALLALVGREALRAARREPHQAWFLALQVSLWVTSAGQPAMGFAYVALVWALLSGLWLGARLAGEEGSAPARTAGDAEAPAEEGGFRPCSP